MSNRTSMTREHRAAVARAWRLAEAGGENQASFCERQSPRIQPRTLRQWVKEFAPEQPPLEQARAIIEDAITGLEAVLARLEPGGAAPVCPPASTPSLPSARTSQPVPTGVPTGGTTSAARPETGTPPDRYRPPFDWTM